MFKETTIIQLEEEPIESENMLNADVLTSENEGLYDWFLSSIAYEYYDGDELYNAEMIESFIGYLKGFGDYVEVSDDKKWIIFKEGFQQAFFESIYPEFQAKLKELTDNTSLDAFVNRDEKMESPLQWLDKIYYGTDCTYIKNTYFALNSLNFFVRYNLELNRKYYIGGVVRY